MTIYNQQRLPVSLFKIEEEKIRNGWYSDKYFCNNVLLFEKLSKEGYLFEGESDITEYDCSVVKTGDMMVEMQLFTRRNPFSLVAGVDEALAIIKACAGYYDDQGKFVHKADELEVEAVQDGEFVYYHGDPMNVQPVLRIRGIYRYFAKLETVLLGVLTEATRVATNVFNVLDASKDKQILFFPARFAHYKMQALHGYAYSVAMQAFNAKYGKKNYNFVSTDEQGAWWGGEGCGTIAHATIAMFFGDSAETMMQFARLMPAEVSRIALIDFHNDCIGETRKIMRRMFTKYLELYTQGKLDEAMKYKLFGVRPDTSKNMRDRSIIPTGNTDLDNGVSSKLVWNLREFLDTAYEEWDLPEERVEIARKWCKEVKIVVTGGFNDKKIKDFEDMGVPVDFYGVGSSLLDNSSETNNDFTADIVMSQMPNGDWISIAKIGRCACNNVNLKRIDFTKLL